MEKVTKASTTTEREWIANREIMDSRQRENGLKASGKSVTCTVYNTYLFVEGDLCVQKVLHHFSEVYDPLVLEVVDLGCKMTEKSHSYVHS